MSTLAYKRFSHFVRDAAVFAALLVLLAVVDGRRQMREGFPPAPPPRIVSVVEPAHGALDRAAAFSADGSRCAVLRFEGQGQPLARGYVKVWDVADDRVVATIPLGFGADLGRSPFDGNILAIALSPSGDTLAFGMTNSILLWDIESKTLTGRITAEGRENAPLAFAADGRDILGADGRGDVFRYGRRGEVIWRTTPAGPAARSLAVSPDGETIAVGSVGGEVYLYAAATGESIRRLHDTPHSPPHHTDVVALAFRPDSETLATATRMEVKVWDVDDGRLLAVLPNTDPWGRGWEDVALAFHPDGKALAIGVGSTFAPRRGEARLWRPGAESGAQPLFVDDNQPVLGLAFSPDGQSLATAGLNGLIRRWDVGGR